MLDVGEVLRGVARTEAHSNLDRLTASAQSISGLALANTFAALEVGVRRFDASLAGIGGCPHAPAASGNAATEDTVFTLERMGYDTGIDLDALLALRKRVTEWLAG